jgi:hypothetical protein
MPNDKNFATTSILETPTCFFKTSIIILVRLSKPPPLMTYFKEISVQVNNTNLKQCNNELKSRISYQLW